MTPVLEPGPAVAARSLAARLGGREMELSPDGSALSWVEALEGALPAPHALAAVEHLFGVLPLVGAFFRPHRRFDDLASGRALGALGLFTPAPAPGWAAAAVSAEPDGGALRLSGDVRVATAAADGVLVLARLDDGAHRVAWVEPGGPGVYRREARNAADGGGWLALREAAVPGDRVSREVALGAGSEYLRSLESYAALAAVAAAAVACRTARELWRAARTTVRAGAPLRDSQLVATAITEVEIEAELAAEAARRHAAAAPGEAAREDGLAVAVAAVRALAAAAETARRLRDQAGLEVPAPVSGGACDGLVAFLGGPLVLESELACALGIAGDHRPEGTP